VNVAAPTAAPDQLPRGPRVWWQGLPRRRRRITVAALVLPFLLISGVLARYLSVENAERNADLALVQAEARGDVAGMLAQLSGCREKPSCVASVKADASNPRLRRTGAVKILQLESQTSGSLFGATGKARVAWTVIGSQPVVQCVEVSRTGNFLTGLHVRLLALGAPISGEGKCTKETQLEREEEEATKVELGER
jgi:hypothetical protein